MVTGCKRCVFVTTGTRCPECGETSAPNYSLEPVRTAERLYGTAYGSGRYNEGLGARTYGKQDFARRVEAAGLRQREPGDAKFAGQAKREAAAKGRKAIDRVVGEAIRHL
jgi:hypothetical protein